MKKRKLFLLPLFCLLITGCGKQASGKQDEKPAEQQDQRQKLATPVLSVNEAKNGLTWAAVADAVSYSVKVNDADPLTVTTPGYAFATEVGQYSVKVVAKADVATYDSLEASFSYETKQTSLGELNFADGAISWASLVGTGLEMKLGSGEYAPVTGQTAAVTQDGTYTLHALPGYDEEGHIFYVEGNAGTKEIVVNTRVPLAAPVLQVNAQGNGLTWAAVEGAVKYSVKVNTEDPIEVTEPGYAFETEAGEYVVKVTAIADVAQYNSQEASFSYETIYTALGALSFDNTNINVASYVGTGLEVKLDGGEFADMAGQAYQPTAPGAYIVHAKGGFVAETNKYYVANEGSVAEKTIVLSAPATAVKVLEDGSAEDNASLKEHYELKYYDGGQGKWRNLALC